MNHQQILESFRKNITSQYGEDGLVEQIFNLIGLPAVPSCIEFGAWDGKYLSNVYNQIGRAHV